MAHSLLSIPAEILELIVGNVQLRDLLALRATCRNLSEKLYSSFVIFCFTSKRFMPLRRSLQTLKDIAHHASFGTQIQTLGFGVEHLSPTTLQIMESSADAAHIDAYKECFDDQMELRKSKEDITLLEEAFRALDSLDTLVIGAELPADDYFMEHVDPPFWNQPVWGWQQIKGATGRRPESIHGQTFMGSTAQTECLDTCEHVIKVVLAALAASGCAVGELQVNCSFLFVRDGPWFEHQPGHVLHGLRACFENLTRLYLGPLCPAFIQPMKHDTPLTEPSALSNFLGTMPALEDLSLVLSQDLLGVKLLEDMALRLHFPRLQMLSIEMCVARQPDVLAGFAEKHAATLRALRLVDALLLTVDMWFVVLEAFQRLPHLERLGLKTLKFWDDCQGRALLFNARKEVFVVYEGGEVKTGLQETLDFWRSPCPEDAAAEDKAGEEAHESVQTERDGGADT